MREERKLYFLATEVNVCLLILKQSVERLLLAVGAVYNRLSCIVDAMILMTTSTSDAIRVGFQHCGPAVGMICPRLHLLTWLKHINGLFVFELSLMLLDDRTNAVMNVHLKSPEESYFKPCKFTFKVQQCSDI